MSSPSACSCHLDLDGYRPGTVVEPHLAAQDETCEPWRDLLALIAQAERSGQEKFAPLRYMTREERALIVTLPPEIGRLTLVRHLELYGSSLERIPPEIGRMAALEQFEPYTSHNLHYLPYEITRCPRLARSTISTRALYGNHKFRPQFPDISRNPYPSPNACSVCGGPPLDRPLQQWWITLGVATDDVPLLAHLCSDACRAALPPSAPDHVAGAHRGGPFVTQPPPEWSDGGDPS